MRPQRTARALCHDLVHLGVAQRLGRHLPVPKLQPFTIGIRAGLDGRIDRGFDRRKIRERRMAGLQDGRTAAATGILPKFYRLVNNHCHIGD